MLSNFYIYLINLYMGIYKFLLPRLMVIWWPMQIWDAQLDWRELFHVPRPFFFPHHNPVESWENPGSHGNFTYFSTALWKFCYDSFREKSHSGAIHVILILPTVCIKKCGLMTKAKLGRERKTRLEERGRKRESSIFVSICKAESFIHSFKNVDTPESHQTLEVS